MNLEDIVLSENTAARRQMPLGRVVKVKETDSRMLVARAGGRGNGGFNEYRVCFEKRKTVLEIDCTSINT